MWHWPIIIYTKSIFNIKQFEIHQSILLFLITIGIGILSKTYIEDFFRFKKNLSFKTAFAYYFLIPFSLTSCFSFIIYRQNGIPSRYDLDTKFTVTTTTGCPPLTAGCFTTLNKSEQGKVLMIGDSHAGHFSNLFTEWFNHHGISLKLFASGGCSFYSTDFYNSACERLKDKIAEELTETKTVIIVKRFDLVYQNEKFIKEFSDFINGLTSNGKRIILLKQVPKFKTSGFLEEWMVARRYGKRFDYSSNEIDPEFSKANKAILDLFRNNKNVNILDFNNILKDNKQNKYQKFDENRLPLYYNSNHLTAYGAEWIYKKIHNDGRYHWVIESSKLP